MSTPESGVAPIAPSVSGPFLRWEDVPQWTDPGDADTPAGTPNWTGRRLVFGGVWLLQMQIERGYHWAHQHAQSQVVGVTSGELLARIGAPEGETPPAERVLRAGDLLLIPSQTWHDLTALTDVEAWEARGMEGDDEWTRWCVPTAPAATPSVDTAS